MKVALISLMILAVFLAPVYGQAALTPPAGDGAKASSDAAIAVDKNQAEMPGGIQNAEQGISLMRTAGGMGLVICIMIGVYFAARKFAPKYFAKGASEKGLRVIETLSMGDRRSISLIEVGGTRLLIGNTPHQINLITTLPEAISLVSEPETLSASQKESFGSDARTPFRNMFEAEKKKPASNAGHPLPEDLRTKMRQLREALER